MMKEASFVLVLGRIRGEPLLGGLVNLTLRLLISVSIPPISLGLPQCYVYQSDWLQNLLTWIPKKEKRLLALLVVPSAGYSACAFER